MQRNLWKALESLNWGSCIVWHSIAKCFLLCIISRVSYFVICWLFIFIVTLVNLLFSVCFATGYIHSGEIKILKSTHLLRATWLLPAIGSVCSTVLCAVDVGRSRCVVWWTVSVCQSDSTPARRTGRHYWRPARDMVYSQLLLRPRWGKRSILFRNSQLSTSAQYSQKQDWNDNNHNRKVSRQCTDRYIQYKQDSLQCLTLLVHTCTNS